MQLRSLGFITNSTIQVIMECGVICVSVCRCIRVCRSTYTAASSNSLLVKMLAQSLPIFIQFYV